LSLARSQEIPEIRTHIRTHVRTSDKSRNLITARLHQTIEGKRHPALLGWIQRHLGDKSASIRIRVRVSANELIQIPPTASRGGSRGHAPLGLMEPIEKCTFRRCRKWARLYPEIYPREGTCSTTVVHACTALTLAAWGRVSGKLDRRGPACTCGHAIERGDFCTRSDASSELEFPNDAGPSWPEGVSYTRYT